MFQSRIVSVEHMMEGFRVLAITWFIRGVFAFQDMTKWQISINQAASFVRCGATHDYLANTVSMSIVQGRLYQFVRSCDDSQLTVIVYELKPSTTNVERLDLSNGARATLNQVEKSIAQMIQDTAKVIDRMNMRIHLAIYYSDKLKQILFHLFISDVANDRFFVMTDLPDGEVSFFDGEWKYKMRFAIISDSNAFYVISSFYGLSQFLIRQFDKDHESALAYYLCVFENPLTIQRSKKPCISTKEAIDVFGHVQYGYTSQTITFPVYLYLVAPAKKTVWIVSEDILGDESQRLFKLRRISFQEYFHCQQNPDAAIPGRFFANSDISWFYLAPIFMLVLSIMLAIMYCLIRYSRSRRRYAMSISTEPQQQQQPTLESEISKTIEAEYDKDDKKTRYPLRMAGHEAAENILLRSPAT